MVRKLALLLSVVFQPLLMPSLVFGVLFFGVPQATSIPESFKERLFYLIVSSTLIIPIVFVEGILHYTIDYTKVKYGCKDNTKPLFWNQFGLDQLAHQVCYMAMAYILIIL